MKNFNPIHLFTSILGRQYFNHYVPWAIFLFFLGGCSHTYIPNAHTFDLDEISEFSTNNTISLVNGQSSSDDILFAQNLGHEFYANYKSWTDAAIEITKRELTERNMNLNDDSQKSLKLSVETVKGTFGVWVVRCEVTLKVATSEGYVSIYLGDNRSPVSLFRAADGAVMRAVAEMLRDEKIVSYLKK